MATSPGDAPLTKRHLYNLGQLPAGKQATLARQVRDETLTALATEKLVRTRKAGGTTRVKRVGLAARQRKFQTSLADVLVTFRKKGMSDEDVRFVVSEIVAQLSETPGN